MAAAVWRPKVAVVMCGVGLQGGHWVSVLSEPGREASKTAQGESLLE